MEHKPAHASSSAWIVYVIVVGLIIGFSYFFWYTRGG